VATLTGSDLPIKIRLKITKTIKMKKYLIIPILALLIFSCKSSDNVNNKFIQYQPSALTQQDKILLKESVEANHAKFDPQENMLTKTLTGYNYHTDAGSGVFHEVRGSFNYAVSLLELGDKQYEKRAFDIIEKTISLQDQNPNSKSCGVWPYYLEEPLATKKAPIDYNWADFNAVSLLELWMGHQSKIPERLKPAIKNALILAAQSIQKRNVGPAYTNIAIMGTYATYMVSNLFDLAEMKSYAQSRLKIFYNYTLDKGGFTEYNSPNYTLIALDELFRMKKHIVEPSSRVMIDSLYAIGWQIIASHYHQPTGQWAGPHSRSYSTLIKPSFYAILDQASNGKIKVSTGEKRNYLKIKHQIPEYLLHYFLAPQYPRTETNLFEKDSPQIIGTSYLTREYALSTANRSGFWNQRRPFTLYWGSVPAPKYLQVRFMHDDYDFSSAYFLSSQSENKVLAAIGFNSNGGDKHINIDRLKNGKFKAKDLRLRFEFGNVKSQDELVLPASNLEAFSMEMDHLKFGLQLYGYEFDDLKGYWEKGGDGVNAWIDFVFYAGIERNFDLNKMSHAVAGFVFSVQTSSENHEFSLPSASEKNGILHSNWNGLQLEIPVKAQAPGNPFF
jgi:hypothetical protein